MYHLELIYKATLDKKALPVGKKISCLNKIRPFGTEVDEQRWCECSVGSAKLVRTIKSGVQG